MDRAVRRHPTSEYIVGRGISREGRAEAEANARVQVAEQVKSSLKSNVSRVESETNGKVATVLRAEVTSESAFAHGELVRVVPEATTCGASGTCEALAVLSRDALNQRMLPPLKAEANELSQMAETALAPGATRAVFSAAWQRFGARLPRFVSEARALLQVSPGAPLDVAAIQALRDRMVVAREKLVHDTPLTVVSGGGPAELRAPVLAAMTGAAARLGLLATSAETCSVGLRLTTTWTLDCSQSGLGPRCAATLGGTLDGCVGEEPMPLTIDSTGLAGAHPSDAEQARLALSRRLTAEALEPRLRAALAAALPLDAMP